MAAMSLILALEIPAMAQVLMIDAQNQQHEHVDRFAQKFRKIFNSSAVTEHLSWA